MPKTVCMFTTGLQHCASRRPLQLDTYIHKKISITRRYYLGINDLLLLLLPFFLLHLEPTTVRQQSDTHTKPPSLATPSSNHIIMLRILIALLFNKSCIHLLVCYSRSRGLYCLRQNYKFLRPQINLSLELCLIYPTINYSQPRKFSV